MKANDRVEGALAAIRAAGHKGIVLEENFSQPSGYISASFEDGAELENTHVQVSHCGNYWKTAEELLGKKPKQIAMIDTVLNEEEGEEGHWVTEGRILTEDGKEIEVYNSDRCEEEKEEESVE